MRLIFAMGELPDYIGAWDTGELCEIEGVSPSSHPINNRFYIFIESRDSKKEGLFFTGRAEDRFGRSKIEGMLTQTTLKFTKQYDEDAKEGAARTILNYTGVRAEYIDIRSTRVALYAGIITRENCQPRTFIMKSLEQEEINL